MCGYMLAYIRIYIYICVCVVCVCVCVCVCILFGPVKPELGVIPSGQENYSKIRSEEVLILSKTNNRMEMNL